MKTEPLKDKGISPDEATDLDYEGRREELFEYEDIKSAVEWLKDFFRCGLKVPEEYILEKIDEAFEDVRTK